MQLQQSLNKAARGVQVKRSRQLCVVKAAAAVATKRVYNFSAGPAILPLDVLEQANADLLNWQNSGMSVMEMSHRGKEFDSIIKKTEADLRTLLNIPSNYKVRSVEGPWFALRFCSVYSIYELKTVK